MERRHQPGPGICESRPRQPTAGQMCPRKVPVVTTSPLPHNATKTQGSCPQRSFGTFARLIGSAFAFSQVNPLRECYLRTHKMLRGHTRIFARAYYPRLNNVSNVAVGRTMCHAGIKSARPSIASSSESQWELTLIELSCPYYLDMNRRSRSDGRKLSIPSTSRTLAKKHGEPSTNLLAGLDAPLACALSRQTPSRHNS